MTRLFTASFLEYLVMLHTVGKGTAVSIISCSHSKGICDLSLTSNTYFVETPVDSRIRPRCPFRTRNARLEIKKYLVDMHSREYIPYLDTFMVSSVFYQPVSCEGYRTYHAPRKPQNGQYKKEAKFMS